jgi:hypothetical protein
MHYVFVKLQVKEHMLLFQNLRNAQTQQKNTQIPNMVLPNRQFNIKVWAVEKKQ